MIPELENILENINQIQSIEQLKMIIDALKRNEKEFYIEVLKSEKPNFLITSYYSLYLKFLEILNSELQKGSDGTTLNSLINFFGDPLLIYLRKKEVVPNIFELSGLLLHIIINWKLENRFDPHEILQIITFLDKTTTWGIMTW